MFQNMAHLGQIHQAYKNNELKHENNFRICDGNKTSYCTDLDTTFVCTNFYAGQSENDSGYKMLCTG